MADTTNAATNAINQEVAFGILPTMVKDRLFGWLDFVLVQTGFGIAAWCFLVGGLTGTYVEGKYAIWIILMGNALPVLMILPFAMSTARYGIDTFVATVASLGRNLTRIFFVIFAILNQGWITIACFMLGESCIKLAAHAGAPHFLTTRTSGAPIFSIIFYVLGLWIAWKGPVAIRAFARIGVPAIMLILFGLIGFIVFKYGLHRVFGSAPSAPYPTFKRSVSASLELNVGLGFSWLVYIGQWCRLARSESAAINGTYLGWGLMLNVAGIFGAFTALLVGSLDPVDWMIPVGGLALGIFGLVLLVLANLTSTVVLVYSQALSVKTVAPKTRWSRAVLTSLPAGLLMLSPTVYDNYQKFLMYVSFVMAAFGGVLVIDWYMRRQRMEVGALYDAGNPHYRYWAGFNPAAVLAVAVASAFYWITYNPVTGAAAPWFDFLGAGIPTFFIAAAVYFISAKTVFAGAFRIDREWQRRLDAGEEAPVMLTTGP